MCSTGRFVGTVVVIDMYELLYCVLVVDCEVGDVVKEVVWFAAAIWLLLILLKKKIMTQSERGLQKNIIICVIIIIL